MTGSELQNYITQQTILTRVTIDPATGCWNWVGRLNEKGYGRLTVAGKTLKSHRVSYAIFKGEFDPELVIDHLCRNRACCNPEHLEPVSMTENTIRGFVSRGYARKGGK